MKALLAITALLVTASNSAVAQYGDRGIICAKYESTGKKYLTEATVVDGYKYSAMTGSNSVRQADVFTLIWWQEGQVTVIKMREEALYKASPLRQNYGYNWRKRGTDQQGNKWLLWKPFDSEIYTKDCRDR